ncbi:hypothetical protein [Actinomadura sp. 7K507]|uniref:hypothetical protein n=1 Tax=Actinomadura sp. 7K507 TaxID=2530365 RepID=UPI00104D043B|nr:hypothetical protein [Actinomadura sp. 7K507]TDC84026.1 hypothetical protein E1285_27605 [Actinomadura sp. 7K507]
MAGWPQLALADLACGDVVHLPGHHPTVVTVTGIGPAGEPITVRRGGADVVISPVVLRWRAAARDGPDGEGSAGPQSCDQGSAGAVFGRTWLTLDTRAILQGSDRPQRRALYGLPGPAEAAGQAVVASGRRPGPPPM